MKNFRGLVKLGLSCVIAGALSGSFTPIATAGSVSGHGKVVLNPSFSTAQISVDAWTDDEGVAQGTVIFVGDVPTSHPESSSGPAGPADPWLMEVTEITFDGNTAYVIAVVVHSVFPSEIGTELEIIFTDNSATGEPDEIDFISIDAGNITVTD
jgi:hypothetical protein